VITQAKHFRSLNTNEPNLLTRIAATESVSLCTGMKSWLRFSNSNPWFAAADTECCRLGCGKGRPQIIWAAVEFRLVDYIP